jgi:transposase-like protein
VLVDLQAMSNREQGCGSFRPGLRRWTTLEKHWIVEESLAPGASVIEVVRRHDLHPSLLTVWRREARRGDFGPAPAPPSG